MKITEWLREKWKNFKFDLNLSTPEEIEERFKPNKLKYPEAKEGERPAGAEVMQPSKKELKISVKSPGEIVQKGDLNKLKSMGLKFPGESKGEEQTKVKNETFEREIKKAINTLAENQELMNDNQTLDREKLKRLDEKLTEVIKMLMDVKDKL